jgi:hypothetical protein
VERLRRHSLTSQQRQYKTSSETNFQYFVLRIEERTEAKTDILAMEINRANSANSRERSVLGVS